jgi:cyclohexadienyl dehydratase
MKHRPLANGVLAIALLIGLAGARPTAARPLAAIAADGTLRVGMTGDYAPFAVRGADGRISGADVTMAESLAKALGVTLVIVPTTWKALAPDLAADRYDIAMGGVSITPDRAALGDFSHPVLHDGKRPIARCAEKDRFTSLPAIDRGDVRVVVNPGGTNERFARANVKNAEIKVYNDNVTIFDEIAKGNADLMMTDASETRYQQKLHAGVLCAVHPDKPFDFSEKAYWLQRDAALKAFVDQWLHISMEDGSFKRIFAAWFE